MVHHVARSKRSFNAQIEFTMHEMKCFMIPCEKLMTAEKASNKKREGEEWVKRDWIHKYWHRWQRFSTLLVSLSAVFCHHRTHISLDGLLGSGWLFSFYTLIDSSKKNIHFDSINICEALSTEIFCSPFLLPLICLRLPSGSHFASGSIWVSSVSLFDVSNNDFWHT